MKRAAEQIKAILEDLCLLAFGFDFDDTPASGVFARNGRIRIDGRMVHDMYLAQVKSPSESKGAWDFYKILATVAGDEAFRPLAESACPLVKR